jgi:RPA family protein
MENIKYKILAYAKANGINEINFQSDVKIVKPSDENIKIDAWNLSIAKPTDEQLNALETEANTIQQEEETAKQTVETDKANGNQKLLDLGLTQAEATALTGYTPPTEE